MNDERTPLPPGGSSIVAKYAGENKEPSDIRQHGCYSAHATELRMLDVRLADGNHLGLPYHYLNEIRYSAPEQLMLEFATCRVTVDGRYLDPVYQALLFNRVGYLAVSDSSPAASAEAMNRSDGEPSILSISVTSADE